MSNNRGSEWRKWDLHVHTPASIIQEYKKGDETDVWARYFKELESLPCDIKVLGINDYWFLDGYTKVKEYKDNGGLSNIDLILPVIEFRLRDYVGSNKLNKINYHIIFSNELEVNDIEREFLHRFEMSEFENRSLSRENLISFGEKIKKETPFDKKATLPSSDLEIGFNNFTIQLDRINELLKKEYLQDKFIRVIGQTEWNDFRWDGSPSDKKSLINGCDFVFSASPTIENARKSQISLTKQGVNDTLLHCSDAHEFYTKVYTSKVLGHCFNWIKSNPTFEGLKQVIHEPNRIKISEFNPSQKNPYQVIKEIKLIDNGELFGNQTIGLNQDLNSIIGGKSSGKSLLLYHLAKAIMSHEKFATLSSSEGFQRYEDLPQFELEVIWLDGHISKLSENENKRPIIYIPQMYLNYMAEKKSRNEDFKQTIDDILKSNDGYKEYIEIKQNEILVFEQKIDSGIKNYFLQVDKLKDLNRELHQLGDKVAVETNIKSLTEQLEELKNKAGLTEEELSEYKALNISNEEVRGQIKEIELTKALLSDLYSQTLGIQTKLSNFITDEFSAIKFKYQDEQQFESIILFTISQLESRLNNAIGEYVNKNPLDLDELNRNIDVCNDKINRNNKLIDPLNKKIQNSQYLNQKQKELEREEKKVIAINLKLKEIETQKQKINIDSIVDLYKSLFKSYQLIVEKHEEYKNISESIDLLSEISFNIDSFERDFSEYITKNRTLETIFEQHGFNGNVFNFQENEHIKNIRHICEIILNPNSSIAFNKRKEKEEIISALFKNYFDISYDLMQGNDRLGHMSPGKKGIILFQLFLHMSASRDPILIDQPEDNLDNRTVYKELNDFIKEKKLQRQIIIVSHNSNLVVSTDSENVIVAHQNSNSIQPKFEYINGALEDTFTHTSETHTLKKQGIREHVCEILEGGVEAFKKREKKYNI